MNGRETIVVAGNNNNDNNNNGRNMDRMTLEKRLCGA